MGRRLTGRAAVFAGAGFAAALLIVGAAHAITENSFNYTSPQTGYLSLHNGTFASEGFNANFRNDPANGATSASGVTCAMTGINLPQGAIITNVVIWAGSTSASFPTFEILRRKASDNTLEAVASGTFSDTTGVRKAQAIPVTGANAGINNNAFAYASRTCVNTTSVFYQARITYTYKKAGD